MPSQDDTQRFLRYVSRARAEDWPEDRADAIGHPSSMPQTSFRLRARKFHEFS